ncbi:MAG: PAS domain-containing protein [Ferruginibacter sp.]|nr:PAS domain-containing protein [Ferruginibacter sp.]
MHAQKITELLEATEKLNRENKQLQQQLKEARASIDAIKSGNIDAVVIANEKEFTIYTEKTSDKTYRILIEKMHEGAVTLNEDGIILYCNSYFANMVNHPLQKVMGTKFKNYIDTSSEDHFEVLLKSDREYALKQELYLSGSNDKIIPVRMSVNTLSLDNMNVLSIIITDLTIQNQHQEELKLRTKQLEQNVKELEIVNKDLTTFTYLSSHDLQEPLRKIQNLVSCILPGEEKNLSKAGRGYFQRIGQTAKRMQALIEALLTYSSAKSSERKFEKADLNSMVEEVKKDFEEIMLEKNATIIVADLCQPYVITLQFRQLLHNLIGNSLKFSKPKIPPRIKINSLMEQVRMLNNEDLPTKAEYCHIIYTDNGIGFDPQYSERIFEVFQRLHSQEAYTGTGMGLAICRRIIENHKGIITASGKINNGTRFDIYIPSQQ